MYLKEFIQTYCKDITANYMNVQDLLDKGDFPYDVIVTDTITGDQYKAIVVNGENINIADILTLGRDEFQKFHPSFEALQAFDGYLEMIEIQEGPEALARIRNAILRNQEDMLKFDRPLEDI